MTDSDPLVGIEVVAAAHDISSRHLPKGKMPAPDAMVIRRTTPSKAWKISTIAAWSKNPAVPARCLAIAKALNSIPLKAA